MQLSDAGLALIKTSEGFRAQTYLDAVGVSTIGYGHRLIGDESYPDGITDEQGAGLLLQDVADASAAVAALVKVPLIQGEFDALVDFTFNLGAERLATSTLLKDLNAGLFKQAANQLLLLGSWRRWRGKRRRARCLEDAAPG